MYASTENYVLPLSHDEVVHGKGSLLGKMHGDRWQQLAGLRLLFGLQWTTPGKKLLFMGGELGDPDEWSHERALPWHLLADPVHAGIRQWVTDLNRVYRVEPALHRGDCDPRGFAWVIVDDAPHGVLAFLRHDPTGHGRPVLVAANVTPVVRTDYRLAVPAGGEWVELLASDSTLYGGSGVGNLGMVVSSAGPDEPGSLAVTLPPLGLVVLAPRRAEE